MHMARFKQTTQMPARARLVVGDQGTQDGRGGGGVVHSPTLPDEPLVSLTATSRLEDWEQDHGVGRPVPPQQSAVQVHLGVGLQRRNEPQSLNRRSAYAPTIHPACHLSAAYGGREAPAVR
jgi:hypothetical protein